MNDARRAEPTRERDATGVRVSLVQFAPGPDADRNADALERHIGTEADAGCDLVVFPEYASAFDGSPSQSTVALAQRLDGTFVARLRDAAACRGIAVVAGMIEHRDEHPGRIANTLVAIDSNGEIVSTYRKVHLYDAFGSRESDVVVPGDIAPPATFALGDIRVGLQTCYDLRFPESSRVLVDGGADVLVIPAQWVPGRLKTEQWTTLIQARAIENSAYVLAVGQPSPSGIGASTIVSPDGVIVAQAGPTSTVVRGLVASSEVARVRRVNPSVLNRRYRIVGR